MKLTTPLVIYSVISLSAATEEDHPNKSDIPIKRLDKLETNIRSWLTDNLTPLGDRVLNRWDRHVTKLRTKMESAYSRPQCGFYSEDIQNGGPDPHPHLRPDGKPRKTNRKKRDADEMLKYDKNNPLKGLKQVTNGFRIWAERHINECGGQRKHQHISKRMQNWMRKLGTRYEQAFSKF